MRGVPAANERHVIVIELEEAPHAASDRWIKVVLMCEAGRGLVCFTGSATSESKGRSNGDANLRRPALFAGLGGEPVQLALLLRCR